MVACVFVAYNAYVFRYVLRQRSYYKIRHKRMFLHTLSGIVTMLLGTWGLVSLMMGRSVDEMMVHAWSVCFVLNNVSGWFLIPKLSCVDPATKREFISLFLVQVIFCPFVYGLVYPEWMRSLQCVSACLIVLGLFTSILNLGIYVMDWYESKSKNLVAGQYLVKQMEKEKEKGGWWSHYVTILFQRGSASTRMPANKRMLGIAVSIVMPFVVLSVLVFRMKAIVQHSVYTVDYQWYTLLMFGTIGNSQVFHGTMSVRGIEKVHRTTNMVLVTTVLEVVTLLTMLLRENTFSECVDYARTVFIGGVSI